MKVIRRKSYFLGFMTFLSLTLSLVILIFHLDNFLIIHMNITLAGTFLISIFLGALCIAEFRKLRLAQLISDNKILHIYPVISCQINKNSLRFSKPKEIEFIISYFGILLGSTIIKFNQDNIKLDSVEINKNFISITYGKGKDLKNTRINYSQIETNELINIVNKIQYETGINPTITE